MPVQEGKPIWVESLLSPKEWAEQAKVYPKTYNRTVPPDMFSCEFLWRYGMGESIPAAQREIINKRLDEWHKKVRQAKPQTTLNVDEGEE